MKLNDSFSRSPGEWLSPDGPESDIVVSTRFRLARNIRGYHMPWNMTEEERSLLEVYLREKILGSGIIDDTNYWNVDDLDDHERQVLVERHLISHELAQSEGDRGVIVSNAESVSIMTNEEDHLRIQVLRRGFQIEDAWKLTNTIDSALENVVSYAFSPRWGYLTACPSNIGTGLRVSVMTHLPMLVQTGQIDKVQRASSRCGLVLRGLYGEGTKHFGDFYQISNQITLGRSEDEIVQNVRTMVSKIVEWERGVRSLLFQQNRMEIEDRVWRAYGQLRSARRISSEETLKHLSALRLGVNMNILNDVNIQAVNELLLFTQPGHLQILRGELPEPEERDRVRAKFIRDRLNTDCN